MTETIVDNLSEMSHVEVLAFTVGYSGSGIERLLQRWDDLMKTAKGRQEALRELTRSAEPLNLESEDRVNWVAEIRAGGGR